MEKLVISGVTWVYIPSRKISVESEYTVEMRQKITSLETKYHEALHYFHFLCIHIGEQAGILHRRSRERCPWEFKEGLQRTTNGKVFLLLLLRRLVIYALVEQDPHYYYQSHSIPPDSIWNCNGVFCCFRNGVLRFNFLINRRIAEIGV